MVTATKKPVSTKAPVAPTKEEEPPKKLKQVQIEIYRKSGNTFFKFSIDPNLEEIFKNQSEGSPRESASWPGLKFYYQPKVVDSAHYRQMLEQYRLFDDFGHAFVRDNQFFNIAFLRTVGGKGTVKIDHDIPFAQVAQGLRNMVKFLKEFHEEFLQDYHVKAELSMEL